MEETQIVFVGLTGSGKTTLLKRLVSGEFRAVPQTMGFAADEFVYASKIRVRAIDLGGQDPFIHTFWKDFIPQADVIVFMIDAAAHSLMKKVRDTLLTVISWIEDKQPILMVLANKQDIPAAYGFGDVIAILNLTEIADMPVAALQIFGCSAKTGYGVTQAFDWLVSRITGTEIFPKAHIYQTYVYESPGVLVGSSTSRSFVSPIAGVETGVDAILANAFYAALARIVKEIPGHKLDSARLGAMKSVLKNPLADSPNLVIQQFVDDEQKFACLAVAEEDDSPLAVRTAAESALAITKSFREIHPFSTMPEEILKQAISPFNILNTADKPADSSKTSDTAPLKIHSANSSAGFNYTSSNEAREDQSFDYTFFTKLSVLDKVKDFD
ncbi:MAG: ADP-ribosylation factor-like protein [Candidatus Hodarchaeota archaeon]